MKNDYPVVSYLKTGNRINDIENSFDLVEWECPTCHHRWWERSDSSDYPTSCPICREEFGYKEPEERTFYVTFAIDGRWTTDVKAATMEEAKEKAWCYFDAVDCSIEIIESDLIIIEDENGNYVYEA